MSNLLSKSNSFKKFRAENKLDADTRSVASSRPKLFSKKSLKLFSSNNTSLSLSNLNNEPKNNHKNLNLDVMSNDEDSNTPAKPILKPKNIVVRLDDYNRMNNNSPSHIKQNSISSNNVKSVRHYNIALNKSASFNARNFIEPMSTEERPILEVEKTDLSIPEPYINIFSQNDASVSMTLFGREDRRMKESLLIHDEKNFNYLNSLINNKNNKYHKLKLKDFDFKMYLTVLDKVKSVEIGIIDYYIKTVTESNWVSFREITELKQRLNLITSSWDKRLEFYHTNMVF